MTPAARLRLWLAVAALAGGLPARAQPALDAVGRAEGLPSDYVLAVVQDRDGFVWFGTDAGVARWDGARAVTFTHDDGLPHAYVYALAQSADGVLWAGTRRGLARFDGRRFRPVRTPFGSTSVDRMLVDAHGRLVVVTVDGMARRERDGRWRAWQPAGGVGMVVPLADGRLFLTTDAKAPRPRFWTLPARGPLRATPLRAPPALTWKVWPAPGGVLVASERGVARARVVGDRLVVGAEAAVPPTTGGLSSALAARDGRLYVGGYGEGGLLRTAADGRGLAPVLPDRAEALAEDYEGGVWVGTFGNGAFRLRSDPVRTLWPGPVLRLARDGRAAWATGDRLLHVDFATLAVRPAFRAPLLRAVLADRAGRPRATGGTRLFAPADPRRPERLPRVEANDETWISGLAAARDTLWVGTYGRGLLRFALDRQGRVARALDTLSRGRGLPTEVVEDVLPAPGGAWLLTREAGALRVRGRRVVAVGRAQGLPSSAVFSLLHDADGTLWVGTDRGLARLRQGRATTLGADALRGHRVLALFRRPAAPGVVWAVADRALVRIGAEGVRVLGGAVLVPDPHASVNAALYDAATDRLLLATTRGLVAVDLGALPALGAPPLVALVGARVDDRPAALAGTPTAGALADLPPGRHRVEVEAAPLTFVGAPHLEVRWDGGPWRASRSRTVALANVGAGAHAVSVRAVSADGVRSSRVATLAFRVRPFWWERWPVQAGIGLALALGLVAAGQGVGRRRTRQRLAAVEAERAAERRVQAERERMGRDLHDHVGGRLAALLAEAEAARFEGSAEAALVAVEAGARETMANLRETVWVLHHESLTARALADRIERFAEARARPLGVAVSVGVGGEPGLTLSPDLALNLYRIAQEAVTNALKHAAPTSLTVSIRADADRLALSVADDGTFRPPPAGGEESYGMRTMAARATALGGTVALTTDGGTTVRVDVPVP